MQKKLEMKIGKTQIVDKKGEPANQPKTQRIAGRRKNSKTEKKIEN